jgi:hypothetical protein
MFDWTDKSVATPTASTYEHWGSMVTDVGRLPEPNNAMLSENCAVANYSQAFGNPTAWGWADTQCNNKFLYVCKVNREWSSWWFWFGFAIWLNLC